MRFIARGQILEAPTGDDSGLRLLDPEIIIISTPSEPINGRLTPKSWMYSLRAEIGDQPYQEADPTYSRESAPPTEKDMAQEIILLALFRTVKDLGTKIWYFR